MDLDEQIQCVKREIGLRERVYPSFVDRKKLSAEKASYEIEAMNSVLKTLETLKNLAEARPKPFVESVERVA